jgi:hypothetical protein
MIDTNLVVSNPCNPVPRDFPPLPVRTHPQLGPDLRIRDELAPHDVPCEEVVVHRLLHDLRDGERRELEEAVVLRGARLLVPGEPDAGDVSELGEVRSHLVLKETVWDAAEVEDTSLLGLEKEGWC